MFIEYTEIYCLLQIHYLKQPRKKMIYMHLVKHYAYQKYFNVNVWTLWSYIYTTDKCWLVIISC
jgi:hypothetical protein